jgi:hypothetical protein
MLRQQTAALGQFAAECTLRFSLFVPPTPSSSGDIHKHLFGSELLLGHRPVVDQLLLGVAGVREQP